MSETDNLPNELSFMQRVNTDSDDFITHILQSNAFVQTFTENLILLKPHRFISKIEVLYFRELKENTYFKCVFIGIFSDIYTFTSELHFIRI